jgi:outer membrane protein
VPIYNGGYRSAKQDEALSLAAKALTDARHTRQQVALQTRAAWLALAAGSGRLVALEESLRATRSRLDATRLAQQVGDRTTLDLLNSENDAAAAELAVLQARITLLLDRMRLALLAGRLDESVLQTVNATLAIAP